VGRCEERLRGGFAQPKEIVEDLSATFSSLKQPVEKMEPDASRVHCGKVRGSGKNGWFDVIPVT